MMLSRNFFVRWMSESLQEDQVEIDLFESCRRPVKSQTPWTVHGTRPSTRLLREGQESEDLPEGQLI